MRERSFFPNLKSGVLAGLAVATLLLATTGVYAQAPSVQAPTTAPATVGPDGMPVQPDVVLASPAAAAQGKKKKGDDKVVQSKDTKKSLGREKKVLKAADADSKLPDRQLYDKALEATRKGHFDVARLDLQTMLNTYPDSQYQMRAKLAIADSWYKEGGTAALAQAESEYADFRVFFPNVPEAAEAQMRIGDIYFRQMDKPDRDYAKAVHAQEEYRRMLTDYPESSLVPQARQRLREVQEVLASREADIASFYATHSNWAATIARYQTVVDTYPQYSHMDDVLVGLGDAYGAEARFVRSQRLPEAAKARLEQIYDGNAAAAYTKVVLEHSAAPHVEDARDRLAAMNLPIPTPTAEQAAASAALENSRASYSLASRAKVLFLSRPDTVQAARIGEPPLVDAKPTLAPAVVKQIVGDFTTSMNPGAAVAAKPSATATAEAPAAAEAPVSTAPLALQDVPTADGGSSTGAVMTAVPGNSPSSSRGTSGNSTGGNSMGVEILPSATTGAPVVDPTGGLPTARPTNNAPMAPIEKAVQAPDAVNGVPAGTQAPAQAPRADGKKTKPDFDKSDESSSKKKKKKGLAKVNPF